jgi:hypothetical protein
LYSFFDGDDADAAPTAAADADDEGVPIDVIDDGSANLRRLTTALALCASNVSTRQAHRPSTGGAGSDRRGGTAGSVV